MSPQDIAELIILVADASLKDSISIETGGRLNKALWKLAFLHQVEKDVNDILQRISTDEMKEAIEEVLKGGTNEAKD